VALVRKFMSHDLSIGGEKVGATLGAELGAELGTEVGVEVGSEVGSEVGAGVGEGVGGQILIPQPQVTVPAHTLVLVVKLPDLLRQLQ
jgi:hypothetical protein